MPSKGKRTAARQAQLSQRRRREVRRTPAPPVFEEDSAGGPREAMLQRASPEPVRPAAAPPTPAPAPARSTQLQQVLPYVTRELRRTALITVLMLLILVVLTLLLRG